MTETNYKMKGCPAPIAFLADTHDTAPGPILASLRSRSPALIVHTGDFLHGWKQRSGVSIEECHNALNLLQSCAELAPTFISIGNHESYLSANDIKIIRSTGVTLLNNNYVTLAIGGRKTVIGGLSSGYYTAFQQGRISASESYSEIKRHHKTPKPDISWLRDFAGANGYHILLMHHPEYITYVPSSVELTLSGHAHGGQWRFYDLRTKQWRGVYAPDQGLLPKLTGGIVCGRQIISRGLSNPAFVPRFHNDTEIVYIDGC